ncbi:MAG: hypothetical protein ABH886_00855 [Candidatus Desantisbacteria bacterium]
MTDLLSSLSAKLTAFSLNNLNCYHIIIYQRQDFVYHYFQVFVKYFFIPDGLSQNKWVMVQIRAHIQSPLERGGCLRRQVQDLPLRLMSRVGVGGISSLLNHA